VALIVIGPEKLPRMARTVGILAGRLQRYVSDVKADINREIELEDLRKMRDSMQQAASDFQSSVQSELHKTETDLNKTVEDVVRDPAATAPQVKDPAPTPAQVKDPGPRRLSSPPPKRKPDERSGKLHVAPDRAAPAADAGGRRGAGAVRGAVHLAGVGLQSTTCCGAADERAARRRQDDRHRRDHAVHGAGQGDRARGFPDRVPYVLYQAWAFVAPGLYEHEKKLALPLVIGSTVLFLTGVAFCYYFVFGKVFSFIHNFAPKSISPAPTSRPISAS